jgi:hypothetical protein
MADESRAQIPFDPLFQREGIFFNVLTPLLEKRGKRRFVDVVARELCSELLGQDLATT